MPLTLPAHTWADAVAGDQSVLGFAHLLPTTRCRSTPGGIRTPKHDILSIAARLWPTGACALILAHCMSRSQAHTGTLVWRYIIPPCRRLVWSDARCFCGVCLGCWRSVFNSSSAVTPETFPECVLLFTCGEFVRKTQQDYCNTKINRVYIL